VPVPHLVLSVKGWGVAGLFGRDVIMMENG
jgi:hypothetical protein